MKTGELGERAFLKKIAHYVGRLPGAKLLFDEDASDIPLSDGNHLIVNVDTFVQGTDWLPGMTAAQAGRKTAVMTLSDIIAKGASPSVSMMSLSVPKNFDSQEASEIIRGFSQYCLKNGVRYLGGDLGSTCEVVITGIGFGVIDPNKIVTRSGARNGDIIAITNKFGLTSTAFEILLNDREAKDSLKKRALQAAYKPEIHFDFISNLVEEGAITASMDSSDGLGITLHTMANLSKVGFVIEDIPASPDVIFFSRNNYLDEKKMVFGGGEEFILVITIPEDKFDVATEVARESKIPLWSIGYVTEGEGVMLETSEGYLKLPPYGYDSFLEWDDSG